MVVNSQGGKAASRLEDSTVGVFSKAVLQLQQGNAFFMTERGFMGLAEGTIKEGDLVAMFCCMEMPLILRPDGENYRLVTHAYLHGMMFGEEQIGNDDEVEVLTLVEALENLLLRQSVMRRLLHFSKLFIGMQPYDTF